MRKKIEIEAESGDGFTTLYATPELGHLNIVWEPTEPATTQPEPWERWRAERNESFWFLYHWVGEARNTCDCRYDSDNVRYEAGNYFRTQELAERHAKRLRSMVPTCAMPKDGEIFYMPMHIHGKRWDIETTKWTADCHCWYYEGIVFASEEAAEAWIAEFGDVWTTRVEGEGE